jgi:lipid II:glycine glycyltransferase (peptidoglycan interpeptide bridge formation enzyme)
MTVSSTPPPGWQDLCESSSAVFGTTDWQQVLESSFSCRSVYVSDGRNGAAVTAFKVGPFSVGYLGFPAGGLTGNADVLESILATLETAGRSAGLTCVRVPVSAFAANASFKLTSVSNPETAIADLQQWDLMGVSKNLRRDIRKAERSALSVERTTDYSLGPTLYGMYESAVKHHGGSLRYNAAYFSAVLELAARNQSVNVYLAKLDHDVIGFAVIVYHGSTAYYLHGGATPGARQLSPSDLVLSKAIAAARSAHCKMFNFMASPTDQPTLVRYKEKWGAETRPLRTYTVPLSAAFPLFRAAESLYRMVS